MVMITTTMMIQGNLEGGTGKYYSNQHHVVSHRFII